MAEETCSNCGRPFAQIYCTVCKREFICGSLGQDCDRPGCIERVMSEKYRDPIDEFAAEGSRMDAPRMRSNRPA